MLVEQPPRYIVNIFLKRKRHESMYMLLSVQKNDLNYIKLYGHSIFLVKHSKKQVIMVIFHRETGSQMVKTGWLFAVYSLYLLSFTPYTRITYSKIEK